MKPKRIVAVSDLHFGSICGLLPANFVTSDGIEIPLASAGTGGSPLRIR